MRSLLEGLNPEQQRAVTTTEGPLLVLAGAGSGKTKVITVRIAWLLANGVAADRILAVTFTNKAATEMRERVGRLVAKKRAEELTIGTFHWFCVRALREFGSAIGLPARFTICDASDQLAAVKAALRELRVAETKIQPSLLQAKISLAKNRLLSSEKLLAGAQDDLDELVGRVWQRYEEQLRRTQSLDFDDLLVFTVRLLNEQAAVRAKMQERYRYSMIDEYQDTNAPQYEIVRAIAEKHRNLCVVGDDDQSIYGWRGADVRKILGFEKDFAGAVVVRLETNYRSTEPILAAANKVIAHNPARHAKTLRSALGPGEDVAVQRLEDENAEADHVTRGILEHVRNGRARFADFAVLFRTATQPRAFEAQFRARAVPYVLVGGMSFFDRKEVRDVLAYLRLVANPKDEMSFLRIVNCPPRGVGKTTVDKAVEFATEHGITALEAFERASEIGSLSPSAVDAVASLRTKLAELGARSGRAELVVLVRAVIDAVDYRAEVDRAYPDAKTREDRWSAVGEILNFAENHARRTRESDLGSFLQALTLSSEDQRDDEDKSGRDAVTLMTLHAAKGLEFPRVYLAGVEEGILPHARAVAEDTVEEERRLMYVGITRAQKVLTITLTKTRAKYGTRVESMPSRFLFEMTGKLPPKGWKALGAAPSAPDEPAPKSAKKQRAPADSGVPRKKRAPRKSDAARG
ncbi:MAG: ATP-dependent helicase [Planctomycetota bacterium]